MDGRRRASYLCIWNVKDLSLCLDLHNLHRVSVQLPFIPWVNLDLFSFVAVRNWLIVYSLTLSNLRSRASIDLRLSLSMLDRLECFLFIFWRMADYCSNTRIKVKSVCLSQSGYSRGKGMLPLLAPALFCEHVPSCGFMVCPNTGGS